MISLTDLGFLIGAWSCTYTGGGQHATYSATFSYDLANNWIRERDAWAGGGGDVAYITWDAKGGGWTYAAFESDRTTTIFRAGNDSPAHIVYRSVYPKTGMTDVFQRVSPTKYTLHFTGILDGKQLTSDDVCVKH